MSDNTTNSAAVLAEVPKALRALLDQNIKYASELEVYRKRETAEEIVAEMDRRGLGDHSTTFSEKVAAILSSGKDLGVVKEAMELAVGENGLFSVAGDSAESGVSALEEFLLS